MTVVAIDHSDIERRFGKRLCRGKSAKPRCDNDHSKTLNRDIGAHDGTPEPGFAAARHFVLRYAEAVPAQQQSCRLLSSKKPTVAVQFRQMVHANAGMRIVVITPLKKVPP